MVPAAGALGSPRLLKVPGFGDVALLRDLGLQIAIKSPDVGENPHRHRVAARVSSSRMIRNCFSEIP